MGAAAFAIFRTNQVGHFIFSRYFGHDKAATLCTFFKRMTSAHSRITGKLTGQHTVECLFVEPPSGTKIG